MAFELLDHRSELARQFAGNLETIITRNPDGAIIPVLHLIRGEGRDMIESRTAARLAENIVSALNDAAPQATVNVPGIHVKWNRQPSGFNIVFQQEVDHSKKMGVLVVFDRACPPGMIGEVSDRLAENNGLAPVLRRVNMVRPSAPLPFVNPSPNHQR